MGTFPRAQVPCGDKGNSVQGRSEPVTVTEERSDTPLEIPRRPRSDELEPGNLLVPGGQLPSISKTRLRCSALG